MDLRDECYNGDNAATNHYTNNESGLHEQRTYTKVWLNSSKHKMNTVSNDQQDLITAASTTTTTNYELVNDTDFKHEKFQDIIINKKTNHKEGLSNDRMTDCDQQMRHLKQTPNVSDDLRISKLLRRLLAEENADNAVDLCKKLDVAVRNQSNTSYICRSFEYLFDAMSNVLKQCPLECLQQASATLGVMTYINRNDFSLYKMYLTKSYTNHPSIRKYLMWALKKTISCDAVNLSLTVHSEPLLNLLKEYLESCDVAETFIAVSETIAEFSKHYIQSFEQHFTDIVDIIIGWFLEIEQTTHFKRHCAKILQEFAPFFLKELQFTYNLLEQFVEDLNASNEEVAYLEANAQVKRDTEKRISAFIGAFSAILKALSFKGHAIQLTTNAEATLTSAFIAIRKSAQAYLMNFNEQSLTNDELIINLNEFLCIMLMNPNLEIITTTDIEMLIELQFQYFSHFNTKQQCSVLCVAWTTVCQLKTKLPITFIDMIMGSKFQYNNHHTIQLLENPMQSLKINANSKMYKFLLKIYHEILKIKNVPLLQRAYYHILNDIDDVIKNLQKSNDTNVATITMPATTTTTTTTTTTQSEILLHFYLNALTALATQAYSIISMYALQPSILELLICNCQASNQDFWLHHLSLHESLLQLLIVYCCKNHNFRQTSRLLTQHPEIISPSSENFYIILEFLAALLKWSNISAITLVAIIDWLAQILEDCQPQYNILITLNVFHDICKGIVLGAFKQPKIYAKLLLILLKYPKLPQAVLIEIRDLALCMIDMIDNEYGRLYCTILAKLPIHICIQAYRKDDQQLYLKYKQNCNAACQAEKNGTSSLCCTIRAKFFKPFIDSLSITAKVTTPTKTRDVNEEGAEADVEASTIAPLPPYEIYFEKSAASTAAVSTAKSQNSQKNPNHSIQNLQQFLEFTELLKKHWSILTYHLQYENAKYCVQQRLRTVLGKPQETFLAFEALIMKYAQILNESPSPSPSSSAIVIGSGYDFMQATDLQQNCHMLLGFLENLDKHIYNAAYGTAYSMPQLDKQVKTFFRINHTTCNDWFRRIHPSINLIALHSLQPELIIRLSEEILTSENIRTNLIVMDRTIVTLLTALLNCGDTDTIKGLLTWLKVKLNINRYDWLQYVAEQCDGHLERAILGYRKILQRPDDDTNNYDNCVREFLRQELIECLFHTARWSEITQIQHNHNNGSFKYRNNYLDLMESIYMNYNNNCNNNETLKQNIIDLTEWQEIEYTSMHRQTQTSKERILSPIIATYSHSNILMKLKEACIHEALAVNIHNDIETNNPSILLNTVRRTVERGVCEALLNGCEPMKYNKEFLDLLILHNVCEKLSYNNYSSNHNENNNDDQQQGQTLSTNERENCNIFMPTFIASKQLMWSLILDQHSYSQNHNHNRNHTNHYISKLLLDTAACARREDNILYCQSLLERFFTSKGFNLNIDTIAERIINSELKVNFNDSGMLRGVHELAKCLYANANSLYDAMELEASCCNQILEITRTSSQYVPATNDCCEMFITMADWLIAAQRGSNAPPTKEIQFQKLLNQLPELNVCRNMMQTSGQFSLTPLEYNVGKLLQASTLMKTDCGSAWLAFGNWCYRWGKKLMENRSKLDVKITDNEMINHGKLSEHDIALITKALCDDFNSHIIYEIINCLQLHLVNSLMNDDGNVEELGNDSASVMDILNNDIRKIAHLSDEQLHTIGTIWRQAHKGVYVLYEEATRAYFKYIIIQSEHNATVKAASITAAPATIVPSSTTEMKTTKETFVEESTLVTITLRILRLIVKHAAGLQEVLEEGLSNTPLLPWRIIVPQLFSRLNHHEPYVRRSVADLLCRLSCDQPQLIIFPAVVGARKELISNENNQDEVFVNCFSSLCTKLAEQAPDTVRHVELLVKELRRIALLWEEYWLHSLGQFYSEYLPLYNTLELIMKKDPQNNVLAAKCEIFMKHLAKDFELIAQVTAKEPETPYERLFQERFNKHINDILAELKKPFDVTQLKVCFVKIKQLYGLFQQRPLRGNASTMKVHDLSPVLAQLQNSNITMPGVDAAVHIKSIDNLLYILPTKTKPKKLAFYGSDGQRYTFLFKGQEDLHLDERIMQFLSISNSMMARTESADYCSKIDYFRAQHYSVIPLGSRSGFISWVDGCTPLFGIYKKWQQRDALLKLQQKERQQTDSNLAEQSPNVANAPRPSELFYEKLQPLLAEHNLKITDSRKQWPIQVLKTVLRQLTKETPSDLLSKELWCHATNAADWHKSIRRYTISVAVMSIIGYVIGLGDRHLDNILIKLSTGEIVHIDYNVCFEKGKTLRVPEKVPCRLTPNILNAFGLTGIEGTFRLSCEYVLKVLRKERETLLTLLEAFVYDPLVDWAVNNDGNVTTSSRLTTAHVAAHTITALDGQVSAGSSICSQVTQQHKHKEDVGLLKQSIMGRCQETKPLWLKFRNDLRDQLKQIDCHLEIYEDYQGKIKSLRHEYDTFNELQNTLKELKPTNLTDIKWQPLQTLSKRYNNYKEKLKICDEIYENLMKTKNDYLAMLKTYNEEILNYEYLESLLKNQHLLQDNSMIKQQQHQNNMMVTMATTDRELIKTVELVFCEFQNDIKYSGELSKECLQILIQYNRIQQYNREQRFQLQNHTLVKYNKCQHNDEGHQVIISNANILENTTIEKSFNVRQQHCRTYFQKLISIYEQLHSEMLHLQECKSLDEQQQYTSTSFDIIKQKYLEEISFVAMDKDEIVKLLLSRYLPQMNTDLEVDLVNYCKSLRSILLLEFHINSIEMLEELLNNLSSNFYVSSNNCECIHLLLKCLKNLHELSEHLFVMPEKIYSYYIMNSEKDEFTVLYTNADANTNDEDNLNGNVLDMITILSKHENFKSVMDKFNRYLNEFCVTVKCLQDNLFDKAMKNANQTMEEEITLICKMDIDKFMKNVCNNMLMKLMKLLKSYATSNVVDVVSRHSTDSIVFDIRSINDILFNIIAEAEENFLIILTKSSIHSIYNNNPNNVNDDSVNNLYEISKNLCDCLNAKYKLRFKEKSIEYQWKLLQQHTLIMSNYHWSNELILKDLLPQNGCNIIIKSQMIHNVKEMINRLMYYKENLMKTFTNLETHKQYFLNIEESSNTKTNDPLQSYENAQILYTSSIDMLTRLLTYCNILLQFESIMDNENVYLDIIQQYEKACCDLNKSEMEITMMERTLVKILDPGNNADYKWLQEVLHILEDLMRNNEKNINELEMNKRKIPEQTIKNDGQQIENLQYCLIGLDLRHLCKVLTKYYKQDNKLDNNAHGLEIRNLQQSIKLMQSKLSDLHFLLISSDIDVQMIKDKLIEMDAIINDNNEKLLLLIEPYTQQQQQQQQQFGSDNNVKSPLNFSPSHHRIEKPTASINYQIIEQKRNAYAVSVWKRIRMKLEGRDSDPNLNRRSTVAEQVDFVIREAINENNLASLYEGWTPWV